MKKDEQDNLPLHNILRNLFILKENKETYTDLIYFIILFLTPLLNSALSHFLKH